jgi:uncharacterized Ntn-hydrolase superfamily protein
MKKGYSQKTALEDMIREDSERETRQVIIVDREGRTAALTGRKTYAWCGHIESEDFVVACNMLVGRHVLEAMKSVYEGSNATLAESIPRVLEAGDRVRGDRRGRLSAALMVASRRLSVNLRVDSSKNSLRQIREDYGRQASMHGKT